MVASKIKEEARVRVMVAKITRARGLTIRGKEQSKMEAKVKVRKEMAMGRDQVWGRGNPHL